MRVNESVRVRKIKIIKHVEEVADTCFKIAEQYGLDREKCRILRFAADVLDIEDKDILSAVQCHTTLKNCPGKYDMMLFVADKLSWDCEGIPPYFEEVKRALQHSLESACLEYITYSLDNGMILYPHRWLLEAKG